MVVFATMDFVERCNDLRGQLLLAELPHDLVGNAIRRQNTGQRIDISAVNALVDEFYDMPDNGAGGQLHVVLDDSNWTDASIDDCIESARASGDAAAVAPGMLLRALTPAERVSLKCVCPCCITEVALELGLTPAAIR